MTMGNYSKKTMKALRELAHTAYERDLERSLDTLHKRFSHWKSQEISAWDLNESIHEFHNDTARNLYKNYTMLNSEYAVSYGLLQSLISEAEIPESARENILQLVKCLKENKD